MVLTNLIVWPEVLQMSFLLYRLEEKLSNIEPENQVLCQQALTMSPTGKSIYA
jgi:myosin V